MSNALALSILALTIGLALTRPVVWHVRIQPPMAAVLGAVLVVSLGLVSLGEAGDALWVLRYPVITIVSLMALTSIADQAGLFNLLAWKVATAARGDGRKLFAYLFFMGAVTGAIFTNDAAVLIFTPLVYNLIESIQDDEWTLSNKIPYYFAVLYVANLVGPLVISNPINILVASLMGIDFLTYAQWMLLPALVSILTSFFCLRFYFRRFIPARYILPDPGLEVVPNQRFLKVSGIVLAVTMVGLFTGQLIGLPIWLVAATAAIVMLILYRSILAAPYAPVVRGIGWDVIVFVVGIFVLANALRQVGLTELIGDIITDGPDLDLLPATAVTAVIAALFSAFINNHPTADMMALTIQGLDLPTFESKMLALAALIGGDLGPKMLPIGSLAALLWFRMLRARGVDISYLLYIRIGIPITLIAILLSTLTLNLEIALRNLL